MRLVMISDTHSNHELVSVPDGDVLIHAGDITKHGELDILEDFNDWLGSLPHRHKLVIAGNHDFCFQDNNREKAIATITNGTYLEDSGVEIDGVYFWGTPWQPWFYDWAFQLHRGEPMREKWDLIPDHTDVLIVHGPPKRILDKTFRDQHVGCEELTKRIEQLQLKVNVFGHIHEAYGAEKSGETHYVNASTCTLEYAPVNPPVVIDI